MLKRKLLVFLSCVAISVVFAACGEAGKVVSDAGSKVGDTMSELGRDESDMMSRVESFVDGDDREHDESYNEESRTESDERRDEEGDVESGYPLIDDSSSQLESESSKLS